MVINNKHIICDKYERISAIRQARNGEPLTVYGTFRDANAIRVYIHKKKWDIEFHYSTEDAEKDVVALKFNQSK